MTAEAARRRALPLAALAALASGLLAIAWPKAEAKRSATKQATFKITIKGGESAVRERRSHGNSACGGPRKADGTLTYPNGGTYLEREEQTQTYASVRAARVTAKLRSRERFPALRVLQEKGLPVGGTVSRQLTPSCESGAPSDNFPRRLGTPDCGTKSFSQPVQVKYPRRDRITAYSAARHEINLFKNCGDVPVHVGVVQVTARLPQRALFQRRRRTLTARAHEVLTTPGSDQNSRKEVRWNMTLRRVR